MASIIFGLKLKAVPAKNSLTLDFGGKKYALPFEVRTVSSEEYIFVHIPPASQIMKITGGKFVGINTTVDAEKANTSFKQVRKSLRQKARRAHLPEDVASALKKVPAGYKLGYETDGSLKLIKIRAKRKGAAKKVVAKKGPKRSAGRPKAVSKKR